MLDTISFSINILFFILIIWLFFLFLGKKNKCVITNDDIQKLTEVLKTSQSRNDLIKNVQELIENNKIFIKFNT